MFFNYNYLSSLDTKIEMGRSSKSPALLVVLLGEAEWHVVKAKVKKEKKYSTTYNVIELRFEKL